MAVKSNEKKIPEAPKLVKNFWPRFSAKTANLSLLLAIASLIPTGLAFAILDLFNTQRDASLIILFVQFIGTYFLLFFLASFTTKPTRYILSALTYALGERDGSTPPNPNETKFSRSGLSPAIEAIYKTLGKNTAPSKKSLKSATRAIDEALSSSKTGFVVFNKDRTISYANAAAPIRTDSDGVRTLDLLFQPADALFTWWDECEESSVRAEKTWKRVQFKLPGEPDARLFDVIASYNNGLENEVTLTLVDQTENYAAGEEELNFIAFAAHELRGPITVIRGYLDVLQDELEDVLEDDHKELFRRLTVSANRLTTYINNILNTSKYDRHSQTPQHK